MKNAKITVFLALLSIDEMKKLGLFVRSPYFNRLNNVTKLYDVLKKFHPSFDSRLLTKEYVFGKIFPGEKFDDARVRTLSSYLFSLAKKFLALERYLSPGSSYYVDSLDVILSKGNSDLAEKELKEAYSILNNEKRHDTAYFLRQYKIIYDESMLAGSYKKKRNYQKEADSLTVFYIASVLRTYATAFNMKSSLELDMRTETADMAARLAEQDPYKRIPVVQINYTLYKIARWSGDEANFFLFTRLAEKYSHVFEPGELAETYRILLNFCVLNIRRGIRKFISVKFELYKKMLSSGIADEERYMSYAIFGNIVTSALENKDLLFAEKFIEDYRHKLHPDNEKDITAYSYAKLYYNKKEYPKALEYLARTGNIEDVFFKAALRDLNIRILYDSGDYEPLFSHIGNYKRFISSHNLLTESVKKQYRFYLKMLERLLKAAVYSKKEDIEELIIELEKNPGFVNRDWVAEKALQITNSK